MKTLLQSTPGALALLSLLTLGTYANTLRNGFIWDDRTLILDNPYLQDVRLLGEGLMSDFWRVMDDPSRFRNYYRPVTTLTFFIDHALWGENPAGFHATNVLLHLATVMLVYALALRLSLPREATFVSAALFAVHPIHTESVAWIAGRTDVLAALLALASLAVAFRVEGSPGLFGRASAVILSVGLYLASVLAKEVALVLPFALLLYALLMTPRGGSARRALGIVVIAMTATALAYIVLRAQLLYMPLYIPGPTSGLVLAFNLPILIGWYLLKLIAPFPMSAHVSFSWVTFDRWPVVLAASALVAGAAVLLLLMGKRSKAAWFSGGFLLLFLLPVLNAGSFTDVLVAERFLYFPSVGFCWLVGILYAFSPKSPVRMDKRILAAAVIALSVSGTFTRNLIWKDEIRFFKEMVARSPDYSLPHVALGEAYLRRSDPESAIREFQEALRLGPTNCLAANLLALSYLRLGVLARSGPTLDMGFSLVTQAVSGPCSESDVLYNTLGEYYMRQKNVESALNAFRRALALNPLRMGYFHNVGTILYATGRKEEARPYLAQFAARAPRGPLRDQAIKFLSQ